jgi:hypothetical protein
MYCKRLVLLFVPLWASSFCEFQRVRVCQVFLFFYLFFYFILFYFIFVFDWEWFSEIIVREVLHWIHLTREREQRIF